MSPQPTPIPSDVPTVPKNFLNNDDGSLSTNKLNFQVWANRHTGRHNSKLISKTQEELSETVKTVEKIHTVLVGDPELGTDGVLKDFKSTSEKVNRAFIVFTTIMVIVSTPGILQLLGILNVGK